MKIKNKFFYITFLFLSSNAFSDDPRSVRDELELMYKSDQLYRAEIQAAMIEYGVNHPRVKALWEKQTPIDNENYKKLENIVDVHGWPTISEHGEEATKAAFLIIQHSKTELQKKYLPYLKEAAVKGELKLNYLAMLEDRILLADGSMQLYGTQLRRNDSGEIEFHPIKDVENVDARRKKMGLNPISETAKKFNIKSPVGKP